MVQILIGDIDYTDYIRQPSIQMDDKLSDPVPTLQFDLEDPRQAFSFQPYQPIVVLEDTQPAHPTHNIYPDPLYATQVNIPYNTGGFYGFYGLPASLDGSITYDGTAGSATFAVSSPSSPTGTLSQTQTISIHPSQTYTFSIYRNISSISNCTVFITMAVMNTDGSTASSATDTFAVTSGGTVRYSKTLTLPPSAAFLTLTYGVQGIVSSLGTDTFSRIVASGWGTASDGQTWANYGDTAHETLSVGLFTGGQATGSSGDNFLILGSQSANDEEVLIAVSSSSNASGNWEGACARYTSTSNTYLCYLKGGTQIIIEKIVGGTRTTLATAAFSWSANTPYQIRFNVTGTTLSGKAWSGFAEPGSWTLTATDSALSSGQCGIYSHPNSTGTTTTFSSFAATASSVCTVVFSHPQLEMQRPSTGNSYPTPDCVPGAANCTQLPDLTTVRETRLWAGYLLIATVQYFGSSRLWSLQASGIACLLSKQIAATYSYLSNTDDQVVISLVTTYLSGLVSASSATVSPSGTTLTLIAGNNSYVKDILDSVGKQCGTVYWIDPYGRLHYELAGIIASAFSLSDSPDNVTSFPYYNYTYEFDASQMVNDVYVLGQEQSYNTTYSASPATGNGHNTVFYVGTGDIQSISVGGTATTAYTYYSSGYVVFTSAPANGAAVQVTIRVKYVPTAARRMANSVGTYEMVLSGSIQDSSITNATDAAARAHVELETYGLPQAIITLTTNQAISSGQRITFTSQADRLFSVDLLVQNVQMTIAGTNEYGVQIREYTATLGPYRADFVHQLLFLQRQLNAQGSDISSASFTVEDWDASTLTVSDQISVVTTTTPNLQGQDTFAHSASGNFGTASDGQTWTTNQSSGSPTISVTGTEGQVQASGSASYAEFLLGSHTVRNVDITLRFANVPAASSGHSVTTSLLWQAVNNSNRYLVAITSTDGSSTSTFALQKVVSGVTTTLMSISLPYTPPSWIFYGTSGFWWLRLHASSGSFTLKAWADGQTEPLTPQISSSDSNISSAGQFGLAFTLPSDSSSYCQVDHHTVLGV